MSKKPVARGHWDFENCHNEALRFSTRSDFMKNSPAYSAAHKKGWLDKICSHMDYIQLPNGTWNKANCQAEALKYDSRSAFKRGNSAAFSASRRKGWLDEVCEHMILLHKPNGYWTFERCHFEALKYKNRRDFAKGSKSAYHIAHRRGLLDKICGHMEILGSTHKRALYAFEHPDGSVYVGLTYDYDARYNQHMKNNKILINKHKKMGHIFKKFGVFYDAKTVGMEERKLIDRYRKLGWTILNKVKAGALGGSTLIWNFNNCKIEAKKYDSRSSFEKGSSGAYGAALKNGWMDLICAKMKNKLKKPVKNLKTGEIFSSLKLAADKYKIKQPSTIKMSIARGGLCAGFRWAFVN